MVATGAPHRPATPAVASAVLLVVVLAGCGGSGGDPPDGGPSPATASPTAGLTEVDGQTDPDYPATAQEYAESAVAAWAAPDLIRLAELATTAVHDEIVALPGPPDLDWTFIRCEEAVGSSACAFHNADGDELLLEVDHELLAGPSAVVDAAFEVTTYPDQAQEYVAALVTAWQGGNPARMRNLAVADAAEVFQQLPPAEVAGYTLTDPDDELATVVVGFPEIEVAAQVSIALLGEPQAVRGAELREL